MAGRYEVKPLLPLRKAVAARMIEAASTIPHFHLVADIKVDQLFALRAKLNGSLAADTKISVNDCMIKACASALMEHPIVNAQLVGHEVRQYHDADISVVVAVEGGLSTPVIRHANRKSLQEISAEVKALAVRAAAGQLKMSEIVGGSFSISNLGGYGVEQFDAIINPPQCAILAVGCARRRVIATDSGDVGVVTMLRATLSVDHRAIDGAVGAAFLSTLQQLLEQPRDLFDS